MLLCITKTSYYAAEAITPEGSVEELHICMRLTELLLDKIQDGDVGPCNHAVVGRE